jgi:hypothetical protein
MKEYLELELKIRFLEREDIVTASIPGEGDKEEDPYHGNNNWWN